MSYGAQTKVGFARQTNPGSYVIATAAPTSYHAMGFVSHDIGLEKDELISQNLIGRFEQGATYDGVSRVNGTIEFEATPRNILTALGLAANHVAAEADDNAGVLHLGTAHVVVAEIDRGADQPADPLGSDLGIVLVDATDFLRVDNFAIVPVRPDRDRAAARAILAGLDRPGGRIGHPREHVHHLIHDAGRVIVALLEARERLLCWQRPEILL